MASRTQTAIIALATVVAAAISIPAHAGCGCDKPPPVLAEVRPAVAYPGAAVTLFGSSLEEGVPYTVTFTSGITDEEAAVSGTAQILRDLADGQEKTQVVVALPDLPLGPASITVSSVDTGDAILFIDDAAFTVAPAPVALPTDYGTWHDPSYQAAVGRDGTVYLALDLRGLQQPMVLRAQAAGYPLRFGGEDVLFYNIQGFLMQALADTGTGEPVPGMFVLPADDPTTESDVLHYSRHEFVTYFLQHEERHPHAVDLEDPNWHLDGTPHIDHDHLILAITGQLEDGTAPAPGATSVCDLEVTTYSLFHNGLATDEGTLVEQDAFVHSYDPTTGAFGLDGDLYSNGSIQVTGDAIVQGDATGSTITVRRKATISGQTYLVTDPVTFMDIKVPAGIPDLGDIELWAGESMTLRGPGSFRVGNLILYQQTRLDVDNSNGPVTLYVTGTMEMWTDAVIASWDGDPERLAIYVASAAPVKIQGFDQLRFEGVIYAPYSDMTVWSGDFFGAFVAANLRATGASRIHYPTTLRGVVSTGIVQAETDDTTINGGNTTYSLAEPYSPTSDATTSDTTTSDSTASDGTTSDGTTSDTTTTKPGKGNAKKK